jgi:hypothetical protein
VIPDDLYLIPQGLTLDNQKTLQHLQALFDALPGICAARDFPDRRTINRWAVKDRDLADRILTARRLGGWAMFDEATDRLMNATPQTIQRRRLGGKRRPSLQSLPATSPAKVAGADGS